MKNSDPNTRLVYSTLLGSLCPECAKPVKECICLQVKKKAVPKTDGVVRLRYETQGRKGKGVTLIIGLPLSQERLAEVTRQLKQRFGTGGAVKDHTIELQGDHRGQAGQELRKLGYLAVLIIILTFLMLPFASLAQDNAREQTQSTDQPRFSDTGWYFYKNNEMGYRLKLPKQVGPRMEKRRDVQQATASRLPYEYVNFMTKDAAGDFAPFELGVGVHWNRDGLGTREFADIKDEGLRAGGAQIVVLRQGKVVVYGIEGVRDDFRIRQPDGWKTYSRIIIPSTDKFVVFLCTLGTVTAVPEYERVFQKIVDSFELTTSSTRKHSRN